MMGLSTMGSISFGCALVAGRKRVPRAGAGENCFADFSRHKLQFGAAGARWQHWVLNGFGGTRPGEAFPVGQNLGKPGTANQFQRRELVAVPVLRRIGYGRNFSSVRGLYAQWNSSS